MENSYRKEYILCSLQDVRLEHVFIGVDRIVIAHTLINFSKY